jgi:hypothetical protein
MDYPDYLTDALFYRSNLYVNDTVDDVDMISQIDITSDIIIEKLFPTSPA